VIQLIGPILLGAFHHAWHLVVDDAIVLAFYRGKAKAGTGLPGQLERLMMGRPATTAKELAVLAGRDSYGGRRAVHWAVEALVRVKKSREISEKAKLWWMGPTLKYELRGPSPGGPPAADAAGEG
jgi:hypothetical protein